MPNQNLSVDSGYLARRRFIREAVEVLEEDSTMATFREFALENLPAELKAKIEKFEKKDYLPEIFQRMAQDNPQKLIYVAMGFNGLAEKERSAMLKGLESMDPLRLAELYQKYQSVLPEAVRNKIEGKI
jgi:galactokinase